MLMSLRSTVSDADGQRSKHWTNCASSMKTSPLSQTPLSPGLVPAGERGDSYYLDFHSISGTLITGIGWFNNWRQRNEAPNKNYNTRSFYWHAMASRQAACDTWATHQPHCILRVWGRGRRGENETESTVKGAKAGEAQSWQRAGNELVKRGEGESSSPASVCLSEWRDHFSVTPKLSVLC